MNELVKSSARTLDILELISDSPDEFTLSDISNNLDIPISSLHALVHTLVKREYLEKDQLTNRYGFGPKFGQLVAAYTKKFDLVSLAEPVMDKIRSQCEEAISMSVLDEDTIRFIHFKPATSLVQVVNTIGSRFPAHATGSGKIMLAYLPKMAIDDLYPKENLPSVTPNTISKKTKLISALAEARRLGYSYDDEESETGVWAVASSICNAEGSPVAAISIVVPTLRVNQNRIDRWTTIIVRSALEISSNLASVPIK
jgi:IclR family acetate operon transcriptional repressor